MKQVQNVSKGDDVVIDVASSKPSDLWKKEDYLAIWLGMLIPAVGLMIFLPRPPANMVAVIEKADAIMLAEAAQAPFKTVAWHQAAMEKNKLRATSEKYALVLKDYLDVPYDWVTNPLKAFYLSPLAAAAINKVGQTAIVKTKSAADETLSAAKAAESAAAQKAFASRELNVAAEAAINTFCPGLCLYRSEHRF
jgi:hypothetical protein